jgi:UDP-glucose 4-epimerase
MSAFLVTGGAGFIGSHLVDALLARGDTVRVLDDLSTGRRRNLAPGATLIEADTADAGAVARALEGVDGCFHLAAVASVAKGVEDWTGTHRTNLTGAITVFDAVRRQGRRIPVVYASSAAVYGDAAVPIPEDSACRPLSAYGADKYGCELHARVAGAVHGIPTVGLRFFNVFGPRQDPASPYSGVISIFCDRILRHEPISIFGDGAQTRDFVSVHDVVRALLGAMALRRLDAPVFNVATGVATSVRALAELVGALTGQAPVMGMKPPRAGEIRHSVGVPDRLDAALGLSGRVALRDGLAELLRWMGSAGRHA